jgi:aspartate carbamoyltransferase catalytic subunit
MIDLNDYDVNYWNKLLRLGNDICEYPKRYLSACNGKIMGTLFYEPSTRTQMSFQSAMIRLGGSIIGFDNPSASSVSKGENLKDTTKIVSGYSDIVVLRHNKAGAAKAAALSSDCPVINAGDGGHLHPTQTLTDLLTLYEKKKSLSGMTIGLCGDLKYGRTVHSLCKALAVYGNKFVLISAKGLELPFYVKDMLSANGCPYTEAGSLNEAISSLDMLYMTRIQRERFSTDENFNNEMGKYTLDNSVLKNAKKDLAILHPLPRVEEIAVEVDDDPRALYFKQAEYGMYIRMALIMTMLDSNVEFSHLLKGNVHHGSCCENPNCITNSEHYLPKSFLQSGDILECEYCDERLLLS